MNSTETKYWFIEFKLIDLIWILRKVRHIIKSIKTLSIFYTNYKTLLKIAKQTLLTILSTDKLNLRFVQVFEYIQKFNIFIRHKFEIHHFVFNALSRSFSSTILFSQDKELNVLFTASMIEMSENFKKRMLNDYIMNQNWIRIIKILNFNNKNNIRLSFVNINHLIYIKNLSDKTSFFVFTKICVSNSMIDEILIMIYYKEHFDFDRIYERTVCSWYIRDLIDHFKRFL